MKAKILHFPIAPKEQDLRIHCLTCDGTDFKLLYSGLVECAECNNTISILTWKFDVVVDDAGEIHSAD